MNLREAKIELREHGYRVYRHQLMLDEGATDMLKKIGKLIHKWKKEADTATKEDDEEKQKEIQDNCEDLKDEIYDKGILNKFRNAKGLTKAIFCAMGILMLSAGATPAMASSMSDGAFSSKAAATAFQNGDVDIFSALDNAINASCADADHCHARGEAVKGDSNTSNSSGSHTYTSGEGDGHSTFSWQAEGHKLKSDGSITLKIGVDLDGDGKPTDSTAMIDIDSSGHITGGMYWHDNGGIDSAKKLSGDSITHHFPQISKTATVLAHNLNK